MRRPVYVVQDHETGNFLAPSQGSVGLVPLIRNAGEFDDDEAAALTALDWCELGFTVVQVVKVSS